MPRIPHTAPHATREQRRASRARGTRLSPRRCGAVGRGRGARSGEAGARGAAQSRVCGARTAAAVGAHLGLGSLRVPAALRRARASQEARGRWRRRRREAGGRRGLVFPAWAAARRLSARRAAQQPRLARRQLTLLLAPAARARRSLLRPRPASLRHASWLGPTLGAARLGSGVARRGRGAQRRLASQHPLRRQHGRACARRDAPSATEATAASPRRPQRAPSSAPPGRSESRANGSPARDAATGTGLSGCSGRHQGKGLHSSGSDAPAAAARGCRAASTPPPQPHAADAAARKPRSIEVRTEV
jgi:hypothetical protein